jgi:predicted small metal-binding protein
MYAGGMSYFSSGSVGIGCQAPAGSASSEAVANKAVEISPHSRIAMQRLKDFILK